jgi:plasmid stability protein
MHAEDSHLRTVEQELRFIARQSMTIEGGCMADLEAADEIRMAVESALKALREYQSSLQTQDGEKVNGPQVAG